MLLLIEDFLKGSQIPKDPKARTQKADQLYIQLVSSMGYEQQQLSESQNNAMVVKIINNIEVITGLKDLYANLAKQQPQQQSSRSKQERKEKRRAGRWEPIRPPQEQQQQSLPRKRPRPRGGVWVPQGIPSRQDQ